MRIYVASSWRNDVQQAVVLGLRAMGYDVYDFRNPPEKTGFGWSQVPGAPEPVDGKRRWSAEQMTEVLATQVAREGFGTDMAALQRCDVCVLVLPCGRSAHLELGWAAGAGKPAVVLCPDPEEPELMYLMCEGGIVSSLGELRRMLVELDKKLRITEAREELAASF